MTKTATPSLVLALDALDRLDLSGRPPAQVTIWQEARQQTLRAVQEREALITAVSAAAGLLQAGDDYSAAMAAGDKDRAGELLSVIDEAEDTLVDALNRVQALLWSGGGVPEGGDTLEADEPGDRDERPPHVLAH